jgi:lipoic acid synthetase
MNKHPIWLREKAPDTALLTSMKAMLDKLGLHSICESANCPNQGRCFAQGTVTFLILGDICTRTCRFCAVKKGIPSTPDPSEPENVAEAIKNLNLNYTVLTSVTRDDLLDGGSDHFSKAVRAIKSSMPSVVIELLVPDFQGSLKAIQKLVAEYPHVINHNIETVPRLYSEIRPKAHYLRSLELLRAVKEMNSHIVTKSGLMLGMGEDHQEVIQVLKDLRDVNCDIVTMGQYLSPSKSHYPVVKYLTSEEFCRLEEIGLAMGFRGIAAGPFVRSSFNAASLHQRARIKMQEVRFSYE